ncbi:ATP-binding protein [Asanoa sp. NPDC049518]|uniref:AAA family ATPase n=1 Tax=unclassified Asanoa TaxID=2685164 RepID=UPI00342E5ABA
MTTLVLTVGLPGTGKTTLAKRLAAERRVLRLTPDEWMAPLFHHNDADGRRDILEGRMIWTAYEVLRSGAGVILDFGCWSPEERYAIRSIASLAGARFELRYLELSEAERRARAGRRWDEEPGSTFAMTDDDHDRFLALFQPPSRDELAYGPLPAPPPGFETWPQWASERWPTLPDLS